MENSSRRTLHQRCGGIIRSGSWERARWRDFLHQMRIECVPLSFVMDLCIKGVMKRFLYQMNPEKSPEELYAKEFLHRNCISKDYWRNSSMRSLYQKRSRVFHGRSWEGRAGEKPSIILRCKNLSVAPYLRRFFKNNSAPKIPREFLLHENFSLKVRRSLSWAFMKDLHNKGQPKRFSFDIKFSSGNSLISPADFQIKIHSES